MRLVVAFHAIQRVVVSFVGRGGWVGLGVGGLARGRAGWIDGPTGDAKPEMLLSSGGHVIFILPVHSVPGQGS